jgi:hypothetical protein
MMSSVVAILKNGLDVGFCSGGRVGARRIYMADDIRKSENYAEPQRHDGREYKYYFIAECFIPTVDKIKTINKDLPNSHVESDPEVMVYAEGKKSSLILEKGPEVTLNTFLDLPEGECYFGTGSRKVALPNPPVRVPRTSTFDESEYTFGNNESVIIRYLVRQVV